MLSAVYLAHPQPGAITGAAPFSGQRAGFLMAFQWLHVLLFYLSPNSSRLSLLQTMGICGEGHPAYRPAQLFSLWKWAVCWSSVTGPGGSECGRNPSNFGYMATRCPYSGTVMESAICGE